MFNALFNSVSDLLLGCLVLVKIGIALIALWFAGKSLVSLVLIGAAVLFVVGVALTIGGIYSIYKTKASAVTVSIGSESNPDLEKLVNGRRVRRVRRVSGRLIASALGLERPRNEWEIQKGLNALRHFGVAYKRARNPKLYILTWA